MYNAVQYNTAQYNTKGRSGLAVFSCVSSILVQAQKDVVGSAKVLATASVKGIGRKGAQGSVKFLAVSSVKHIAATTRTTLALVKLSASAVTVVAGTKKARSPPVPISANAGILIKGAIGRRPRLSANASTNILGTKAVYSETRSTLTVKDPDLYNESQYNTSQYNVKTEDVFEKDQLACVGSISLQGKKNIDSAINFTTEGSIKGIHAKSTDVGVKFRAIGHIRGAKGVEAEFSMTAHSAIRIRSRVLWWEDTGFKGRLKTTPFGEIE